VDQHEPKYKASDAIFFKLFQHKMAPKYVKGVWTDGKMNGHYLPIIRSVYVLKRKEEIGRNKKNQK